VTRQRLEVRDGVLAPVAVTDADGEVVGGNLGVLIRRLILFEHVIIDSTAMKELPALIDALGPEGFTKLLESGAVAIRADSLTFGETGSSGFHGSEPLLLLFHYHLAPLEFADRKQYVSRCLGHIRE
jgi:hypothetical protein